jgi:hypothetical protein
VHEIDEAEIVLLPNETRLDGSGAVVQPDASIASPHVQVLVESKRIRSSAFQPWQLAREYLAVRHQAGTGIRCCC